MSIVNAARPVRDKGAVRRQLTGSGAVPVTTHPLTGPADLTDSPSC